MRLIFGKTTIHKFRPRNIKKKIKSLSWNLYLQFWKLTIKVILETKMIHRDIDSTSNELLKLHEKNSPIVLITSSLRVSKFPLSYTPTRSVFSEKKRLAQTKTSIESVLGNFPTSEIFLIDNSSEEEASLQALKIDSNVKTLTINSKVSRYLSKSPYKGLGEAYVTLALLKICKDEDSDFCKLSGRYHLTPNNKDLFPINRILFKNLNSSSITVFYAIGDKNIKQEWFLYLYENLWRLAKGAGIEDVFYSFTEKNGLQDSPMLFVEGLVSTDGSSISF